MLAFLDDTSGANLKKAVTVDTYRLLAMYKKLSAVKHSLLVLVFKQSETYLSSFNNYSRLPLG